MAENGGSTNGVDAPNSFILWDFKSFPQALKSSHRVVSLVAKLVTITRVSHHAFWWIRLMMVNGCWTVELSSLLLLLLLFPKPHSDLGGGVAVSRCFFRSPRDRHGQAEVGPALQWLLVDLGHRISGPVEENQVLTRADLVFLRSVWMLDPLFRLWAPWMPMARRSRA